MGLGLKAAEGVLGPGKDMEGGFRVSRGHRKVGSGLGVIMGIVFRVRRSHGREFMVSRGHRKVGSESGEIMGGGFRVK